MITDQKGQQKQNDKIAAIQIKGEDAKQEKLKEDDVEEDKLNDINAV